MAFAALLVLKNAISRTDIRVCLRLAHGPFPTLGLLRRYGLGASGFGEL